MMEGPLSKWTNVIEGWQYRWFVLDEQAGMLSYYTSAVVGIDDEDDSTFTITVDQKMFHFQARDAEERDRWIRALEIAINRRSGYRLRANQSLMASAKLALTDFERRISEADAYLQLMINQIKALEEKQSSTTVSEEKTRLKSLIESANAMLESVKHSIVLLQIAKSQIVPQYTNVPISEGISSGGDSSQLMAGCDTPIEAAVEAMPLPSPTVGRSSAMIPVRSYSSSDDEPYDSADINGDGIQDDDVYFDTVEYTGNPGNDSLMSGARVMTGGAPKNVGIVADPVSNATSSKLAANTTLPTEPDFSEEGVNFDAIYEDDSEDELENVQEHGSVVMHLLSQLSVGMDLTKITLPTFILERRSLLEMFADFFAHPDLFANIADCSTPEDRMTAVVKWYLSSFHAGRKSSVAKKPYNPILGETFHCRWDVPEFQESQEHEQDGSPFPGSRCDQLTFIAEQVSHHPPVSAFYAELPTKRLQLVAHIWTKSKFLGLSIAVHMVGQATLTVLDYDEEYILTFPSGYGRSILTTPWVEMVGKCVVKCEKTGYHADIDFLAKPFYGGRAHCVKADVYRPVSSTSSSSKSPYLTIRGQWNGVMQRKTAQGNDEVFLDVHRLPITKKQVESVASQDDFESRKLWRNVTAALKRKDVQKATKAKQWLEQRQRNEAKERLAAGTKWDTKYFQEAGTNWLYRSPLHRRQRESSKGSSH